MKQKQHKKISTNEGINLTSNSRGITLIALIITIIVMLILVAVSVTIAINGGLFNTAKKAAKGTEKAKKTEQELSSERIKIDGIWYDSFEDYVIGKESEIQGVEDLDETNTTFTYNPKGWTNGEVKVAISTTALTTGYTLQYSTDGINWSDYMVGTEISVSRNGAIFAKLIDSTGNEGGSATANVANIDTKEPTISTALNAPSTTTSSINLKIGVTDNVSGFSKIEWYYKQSTASTYTPVMPAADIEMFGNKAGTKTEVTKETRLSGLKSGETYNIYAIVYDVAGNSTRSPETGTIDVQTAEMPKGDASINFSYSNTNWTNQSVNVTITDTSGTEGYTLQYSKDGTTWTNYTASVPMSANGKIFAKLIDSQGNEGSVATANITNIDTTGPTITTLLNAPSTTTSSINLSIGATDTVSGFSKIEWYYKQSTASTYTPVMPVADTEMFGSVAGTKTEVTKEITLSGLSAGVTYNIYAIIYDVAGNSTRYQEAGTKDVSTVALPSGEGNISFSYSNTNWTNQSVDVTITKTSGTEGYTLQYSMDGDTWIDYSSPVPMSTNGKIYARLRDGSGNGGAVKSEDVKIDTEAPEINTHLKSTSAEGTTIALSITVTDSVSGISKIEWNYKLSTASNYTTITDEYTAMNGSTAGTKTAVTKTKTLSGLTAGQTYDIYAIVYDVAGNSTRSPEDDSISITLPTISPTTCSGTLTLIGTNSDASAECTSTYCSKSSNWLYAGRHTITKKYYKCAICGLEVVLYSVNSCPANMCTCSGSLSEVGVSNDKYYKHKLP